jgi:hypothetical protein
LCCPSQLCMYILRRFSSWESRNGKAEREKGEEEDGRNRYICIYMLFR